MKKIAFIIPLVLMVAILSACTSKDRYVQWETEAPTTFPKLTAIGYATLASQSAKTEADRILMAMEASKIAALKELAEQVYGTHITASSQVDDWTLTGSQIQAQVSGLIKGAKVVKSYPAGEHYITEVELDFAQVWNLYQQQQRPQKVKSVTYF